MPHLKKLLLYGALFILATAAAFAQEAKNALLIANGDYARDMGALPQPIPEATALLYQEINRRGAKEIEGGLNQYTHYPLCVPCVLCGVYLKNSPQRSPRTQRKSCNHCVSEHLFR